MCAHEFILETRADPVVPMFWVCKLCGKWEHVLPSEMEEVLQCLKSRSGPTQSEEEGQPS